MKIIIIIIIKKKKTTWTLYGGRSPAILKCARRVVFHSYSMERKRSTFNSYNLISYPFHQ